MRLRHMFASILLAAPLALAADNSLLQLAPAGSKFIVGARLEGMRPLMQKALAEAKSSGNQLDMVMAMVGFDPTHDLDEVMIAITGTGQNPPTLFAARGHFAALRQRMGGQKTSVQFRFLDDSTVVGGDAALVKAAIVRAGAGSLRGLAAQAAEFSRQYDIYGVGSPGPASPGTPDLAQQVDRIQFGVRIREGIDMTGELASKSPEAAQAMAMILQGALAAQQKNQEFIKRLEVAVDGSILRVSFRLSQEELERAVRQNANMAALQQAVPGGMAARPAALRATPVSSVAAEPEVQNSRVPAGAALVITGSESDGGTVVVPRK